MGKFLFISLKMASSGPLTLFSLSLALACKTRSTLISSLHPSSVNCCFFFVKKSILFYDARLARSEETSGRFSSLAASKTDAASTGLFGRMWAQAVWKISCTDEMSLTTAMIESYGELCQSLLVEGFPMPRAGCGHGRLIARALACAAPARARRSSRSRFASAPPTAHTVKGCCIESKPWKMLHEPQERNGYCFHPHTNHTPTT